MEDERYEISRAVLKYMNEHNKATSKEVRGAFPQYNGALISKAFFELGNMMKLFDMNQEVVNKPEGGQMKCLFYTLNRDEAKNLKKLLRVVKTK